MGEHSMRIKNRRKKDVVREVGVRCWVRVGRLKSNGCRCNSAFFFEDMQFHLFATEHSKGS